MSLPWSGKGSKATPVGADEVMLIDSADSDPDTTNKRARLDKLPSSGQINSGENLGAGVQIFKDKPLLNLRFKTLNTEANLIDISANADTETIDFNIGSNVARRDQANTYATGAKQSFVASTTTAGININNQTPSSLVAGDIFRNTNTLRYRGSTITRDIVDLSLTQILENKTIDITAPNTIKGLTLGAIAADNKVVGASTDLTDTSNIAYLDQINDFTLGTRSLFFASSIGTVPTTGVLRFASIDDIVWKNSAGDGDLVLEKFELGLNAFLKFNTLFIAATSTQGNPGDVLTSNGVTGVTPTFQVIPSPFPVPDSTSIVEGSADSSKQLRFEIDAWPTTSIIRVLSPPDADGTIVLETFAQDLTNKTFTGITNSFNNTSLRVTESGGGSDILTIAPGTLDANRTVSFPDLTANDTFALLGVANTYTAGFKQSFQGNATAAGININAQSTPSAQVAGDFWRETDVLKYRNTANNADIVIATTSGKLSQFATPTTTSGELAAIMTDTTGTGQLVFADTPTFITPALGVPTGDASSLTNIPMGNAIGTLAVGNGGTGITLVNQGGVLFGNSTSAILSTAAGIEGQSLVSHGTSPPTFENPTLPNVVIVRSVADLPDALLSTLTSVGGSVSNPAIFTFTVAHGYSEGQTVEIITDPTEATYDGFHVIENVTEFTFEVAGINFTVTATSATDGVTRCLANNTNYVISVANLDLVNGLKYIDGANVSLTSSNRYVNQILFSGPNKTFLTGRNIGTIEIDLIVTDTSGAFPATSNTLFNMTGTGLGVTEILFVDNSRFNFFSSLGTITGLSIGLRNTLFIQYITGLVTNNTAFNVSRIVAFTLIPGNTFLTIENLVQNILNFPITSVFSGNTFTLPSPTSNVFNVKPNLLLGNTIVVTNSTELGGGNYFQPSTGLEGSISTIRSTVTGTITSVADAGVNLSILTSSTTGLSDGDIVVLNGTTDYDGEFVISNLLLDTSFEVVFANFVGTRTGTWDKVIGNAVVTTSAPHSLANGQSVEIAGTVNSEGISLVSNASGSVFQIPNFKNTDITGTFKQARVITLIADEATNTGAVTGAIDNTVSGTTIQAASIGTTLLNGDKVTITGSIPTDYNGTHTIFNVVDSVSFDIAVAFNGDATAGIWTENRVTLTIETHGLTNGTPILVNKTVNYDGGAVIKESTASTIIINRVFVATETSGGLVFDGSLDQTAVNVLLNTVSGEVNSKAKGSFSLTTNTEITNIVTVGIFVDLNLDSAKVVESSDTELFRVIDKVTGEIEYRGIQPFSGQLSATISATKESTANDTRFYTMRAVKNGGVMIDDYTTNFAITGNNNTVPVSLGFLTSITAVTSDKFKLQITNPIGQTIDDPVIQDLTMVTQ